MTDISLLFRWSITMQTPLLYIGATEKTSAGTRSVLTTK